MLGLLIFGVDELDGGAAGEVDHEVFGVLDGQAEGAADDVVGDFDGVALDLGGAFECGHGVFDDGEDDAEEGLAGALAFAELLGGVGGVVVAADGDDDGSFKVLEADGVLVAALLNFAVDVEFAAAVEGEVEAGGGDVEGDDFELTHGALLEGAKIGVADLLRRDDLGGGAGGDGAGENEGASDGSGERIIFAHIRFLLGGRVDPRRRG